MMTLRERSRRIARPTVRYPFVGRIPRQASPRGFDVFGQPYRGLLPLGSHETRIHIESLTRSFQQVLLKATEKRIVYSLVTVRRQNELNVINKPAPDSPQSQMGSRAGSPVLA